MSQRKPNFGITPGAAVSALGFPQLIDVFQFQGVIDFCPLLWGALIRLRLGKSWHSPTHANPQGFSKGDYFLEKWSFAPPKWSGPVFPLQPQQATFDWIDDSPSDLTPSPRSGTWRGPERWLEADSCFSCFSSWGVKVLVSWERKLIHLRPSWLLGSKSS